MASDTPAAEHRTGPQLDLHAGGISLTKRRETLVAAPPVIALRGCLAITPSPLAFETRTAAECAGLLAGRHVRNIDVFL
jgi:hypothetical protein